MKTLYIMIVLVCLALTKNVLADNFEFVKNDDRTIVYQTQSYSSDKIYFDYKGKSTQVVISGRLDDPTSVKIVTDCNPSICDKDIKTKAMTMAFIDAAMRDKLYTYVLVRDCPVFGPCEDIQSVENPDVDSDNPSITNNNDDTRKEKRNKKGILKKVVSAAGTYVLKEVYDYLVEQGFGDDPNALTFGYAITTHGELIEVCVVTENGCIAIDDLNFGVETNGGITFSSSVDDLGYFDVRGLQVSVDDTSRAIRTFLGDYFGRTQCRRYTIYRNGIDPQWAITCDFPN